MYEDDRNTPSFHSRDRTFSTGRKIANNQMFTSAPKNLTAEQSSMRRPERQITHESREQSSNLHSMVETETLAHTSKTHYQSYRPLLFETERPKLVFVSQIQEEAPVKSTVQAPPPPPRAPVVPGDHFDDYTLRRLAGVIVGQFDANRSNYIENQEVGQMMAHGYDPAKASVGTDPHDCETYLRLHDSDGDGK